MNISEKLKIIQKVSGLTQTQLAQKFNVSFPTLNSWINERSIPHNQKTNTVNIYFDELTNQAKLPNDPLKAKKQICISKSKAYKNIVQHIVENPDIYDQFVLSLTYNTNSIEGSTLTENDTAAIIFHNATLKNKDLIEHLEAKNHQSALEYLFKNIKTRINEKFILELHQILMNSIRSDAGSYRTHGVRIVGAKLMKEIISEINNKEKDAIAHVSRIHSKFEQIHPFSDGNGRVGRLIMTAMFLKMNLPPAIIKQKKKQYYYKYLQKAQQKDEFEMLEDFICDSILNGYEVLK